MATYGYNKKEWEIITDFQKITQMEMDKIRNEEAMLEYQQKFLADMIRNGQHDPMVDQGFHEMLLGRRRQ